MKAKGFKQSDLARESGVSPTYISQLMTGLNQGPSLVHLDALAAALKIPLAELISTPEEFKALTTHKMADCLEVVRDILSDLDLAVYSKRKSRKSE